MLTLAQAARTFCSRPSEMLHCNDYDASGTLALQIDLAAAVTLWKNSQATKEEPCEREERW